MNRCIALVVLALSIVQASADVVQLARGGAPVARIYADKSFSPDSPPQETGYDPTLAKPGELIDDLQYHLSKITGAKFEAIYTDDPSDITPPAIVVGHLAVTRGAVLTQKSESLEGFRILTSNGCVLIAGESARGVSHGVYEFLQQLGCDWVMPGTIGEIIPKNPDLAVQAIDIAQAPDFLFRFLWLHGYTGHSPDEDQRMYLWERRHKGGFWHHPANDTGSHAWEWIVVKYKDVFDKNPDMLALRRGPDGNLHRLGPQIETTNPKVVQLFADDIRKTYQEKIAAGEWTRKTAAGFAIGPADGLDYSISPESINASAGRMDAMIGELDRTDHLVLLGNQILEQIQDEFPNALVGFYCYSVHSDYPLRYKPLPNIVITFAPISYSRYHSFLDPESKTQAYYKSVLDQWAALSKAQGNKLIYRGYNWNLAENMAPFCKAEIWGKEIPYYKSAGIIGLHIEGSKSWSVLGPSDYVLMRLMWNTRQPWQDVLRQYCLNAYGDGAAEMEQYWLHLVNRQRNAGQEAGSYHALHLIFDKAWVGKARGHLSAAVAAAKLPEQRERIEFIAMSVKAMDLYLDYHAATLRFDFVEAAKQYRAMLDHYEQCYKLNTDLVSNYVPEYLGRFVGQFVAESVKYSSAPYRMVHPIPDELPTMLDPNSSGDRLNYFSTAINDSSLFRTRTTSTTWDAQGLGASRSGSVWYRHHFKLTDEDRRGPVGLFIGGVDDEARVWVNDKLIGSSGVGFSLPFVFDLTDEVTTGETLLAIQVIHNSGGNEIGTGGILRPSFIFSGPRLKQRAPQRIEDRRLLPGGAVDIRSNQEPAR